MIRSFPLHSYTILFVLILVVFQSCTSPPSPANRLPGVKLNYRVMRVEADKTEKKTDDAAVSEAEKKGAAESASPELKASDVQSSTPAETAQAAAAVETAAALSVDPATVTPPPKSTAPAESPGKPGAAVKKKAKNLPGPGDIGYYHLTGVIKRPGGGLLALVEELPGKGYIVSEGNFLGISTILVRKIFEDRVLVEWTDPKKRAGTVEMFLEKDDGEAGGGIVAATPVKSAPKTVKKKPSENLSFSSAGPAHPLQLECYEK